MEVKQWEEAGTCRADAPAAGRQLRGILNTGHRYMASG